MFNILTIDKKQVSRLLAFATVQFLQEQSGLAARGWLRGFQVGTDRWALTDVFPAGVAVLGVQGLKAGAAVRPALFHDVTLAAQNSLALETAKVLHVPVPALCLCALI